MTRPVYKATRAHEVQVTYIMDSDDCPLAEIHLGRWSPKKYSVLLRRGLETFVHDGRGGMDGIAEYDTIQEAAVTVDLFMDCNARGLFS